MANDKKQAKKEDVKLPTPKEATTTALAVGSEDGAWGGENLDNSDIVIPKLLLMQPMSELVTDGIARIGEYRSSIEKDRVVGDEKTAFEFIIFGSFKTIIEFKDGEYLTTKPFDADLAANREEILEDGSVVTRTTVLNFYGLVVKDIATGEPFPFVLPFKNKAMTAGKTIGTHIKKLQMFKKPSASKVFEIGSKKETNDKGTFFVPTIKVGRDSSQEELKAAYEWYKVLSKAKVRVDDSDLKADSDETETAGSSARTATQSEATQ